MLGKCSVDDSKLKLIGAKTNGLIKRLKSNKSSLSTLGKNLYELLKAIKEDVVITPETTKAIINKILDVAKLHGFDKSYSELFNVDSLKTQMELVVAGLEYNPKANSLEKNVETKVDQSRRISSTKFLDTAYGLAGEVRTYAINITNENLFDSLFVNRGSISTLPLGLTITPEQLNQNIRVYQLQLLLKVVKYLRIVRDSSTSRHFNSAALSVLSEPVMYDHNRKYTGALEKLFPMIEEFLLPKVLNKNGTGLNLRDLFNIMNNHNADPIKREEATTKLEAYNACLILMHFDSYLANSDLKDIIEIVDFGKKIDSDKYRINPQSANVYGTWRTDENIDPGKEVDGITKLAIKTTKVYKYGTNINMNLYMKYSEFLHFIGKIKELVLDTEISEIIFNKKYQLDHLDTWLSFSVEARAILDGHTLPEIIALIRFNPRRYAHIIFEVLTNEKFRKDNLSLYNKLFTKDELNKLWSLNKGVFNGANSIRFLVNPESALLKAEGIDYYSNICQVIDSIFNVKLLQYFRDESGQVSMVNLRDYEMYNIFRSLVTTIDIVGSKRLMGSYDSWKLKMNVNDSRFNSKSGWELTYRIPNTDIRVTVKVDGSVKFRQLNGEEVHNFAKLWEDSNIRKYVDDILLLQFSLNIELQQAVFRELSGDDENIEIPAKILLGICARVAVNLAVSLGVNSVKDLDSWAGVYKTTPKFNYLISEMSLVHLRDFQNVRRIANALANVRGLTISTTVRNGESKSQQSLTLSRLLGSYTSQWYRIKHSKENPTADHLMILNVKGLFEGHETVHEYHSYDENKRATKWSASEMAYSCLITDWVGGLMKTTDVEYKIGNGHVCFLPSVNSEKNTIGRIFINLNTKFVILPDGKIEQVTNQNINSGNVKTLIQFKPSEIEQLISQELGQVYFKSFQNICGDWKKLFDFIGYNGKASTDYLHNFKYFRQWFLELKKLGKIELTLNEVDYIKSQVSEYNKINPRKPILLIDLVHYQGRNLLEPNKVLLSQLYRFNSIPKANFDEYPPGSFLDIHEFFLRKQKELVKDLFTSGLEINLESSKQRELLWLNANYKEWKDSSGNIIWAKHKGVAVNKYTIDNIPESELEINPLLEKYNLFDYLFTLEFMISTVGSLMAHPSKVEESDYNIDEISSLTDVRVTNFNNYTEFQGVYSRAILTKEPDDLGERTRYRLTFDLDISKLLPTISTYLKVNDELVIDGPVSFNIPGMFEYSSGVFIKTHNLRKRTTEDYFRNLILEEEAGSYQALHKRNVENTATMHAFTLNLLDGIPSDYNICVIDDIEDYKGVFSGNTHRIRPFDGATFVNPFMVILENNSLKGARAGNTKKQFVHFYDERTGTGGIIKTAGFGMNNDWLRESPFLQGMMKRMTDRIWLEEDGTTPFIGNIKLNFRGNDILYEPIYFQQNGKFYKVTSFENIGDNKYRREIYEVYEDGSLKELVGYDEQEVNTNYKLWNFFGGMNSMSLVDGKLLYSNASCENVVLAMNNVSHIVNEGIEVSTLEDVYQPLKHSDFHYMPTVGAVKHGAANINSASKYESGDLDFMIIKAHQIGILLDKEHHADESEISLMTQVISAAASMGYTFTAAARLYSALALITKYGLGDFLTSLELMFTDPSKAAESEIAFDEIFIESLVKALKSKGVSSTTVAEKIVEQIEKAVRENGDSYANGLLPLSDNTLYTKVISTINSFLTNSGIKLHIPGILSVLTPSYLIEKLYAGRKRSSYTDPDNDLDVIQALTDPIFERDDNGITQINNLSLLSLETTYWVERILPNGDYETKEVTLSTPQLYKALKRECLAEDSNILSILENIPAGRNLRASNIRYKSLDGREFQIWDLDSLQAWYDFNQVKNSKLKLIDFYRTHFHEDLYFTGNTYQDELLFTEKYNEAKKRVKRWALSDFNNLSKNYIDKNNLLDKTYERYKNGLISAENFIQLANIILRNGNGNKLYVKGYKVNGELQEYLDVTDENIDSAYEYLKSNTFKHLGQVRVDGEWIDVDRKFINYEAAEIILPKVFKTYFGLSENVDLKDIADDNKYFVRQLLKNRSSKCDNYTIQLKVSNGRHYYILDRKHLDTLGLNISQMYDVNTDYEGTRFYRYDSKGNIIYELSSDEDKIFLASDGRTEIIITDNVQHYVDHLSYDSVQINDKLDNWDEQINILEKSKRKVALDYVNRLKQVNPNVDYEYEMTDLEFNTWEREKATLSLQKILGNERIMRINLKALYDLSEEDADYLPDDHYLVKIGKEKHSAFLKSLEVLAARIPAQSMQSFMAMKVVAFDNLDNNTAYVSTLLILLQGSDYDIDAVSIQTFDIDPSGRLFLWSPYANQLFLELLNASIKLPMPTGTEYTIHTISDFTSGNDRTPYLKETGEFFNKYKQLFYIDTTANKGLRLRLNLDTVENIELFAQFLEEIETVLLPGQEDYTIFGTFLHTVLGISDRVLTSEEVGTFINKLKKVIDRHNLYLNTVSRQRAVRIANNYNLAALLDISTDAANAIEASTPVDETTKALKKKANNNKLQVENLKRRTPGNFFNKIISILENMIGKESIGITAIGLKTLFGLELYANHVLNYGTKEEQLRLIFKDIEINKKAYEILANVRAIDPNTIHSEILAYVSKLTDDEDVALTLSALLSLATDNAKELCLSKLNANPKLLGMYIYGLCIGVDFDTVSDIIMSPVGDLFNDMLNGNVFTGKNTKRLADLIDTFEFGPLIAELRKFHKIKSDDGHFTMSPITTFFNYISDNSGLIDFEVRNPTKVFKNIRAYILKLGRSTKHDADIKVNWLELVRTKYTGSEKMLWNQMIDYFINYIRQYDDINNYRQLYKDIKVLAEGAEELRILGQLFSLNQGIKIQGEKFINLMNNLARAIYDRKKYLWKKSNYKKKEFKPSDDDIIDIELFAFNPEYREEKIREYEQIKHTFNILDAVSRTPHFLHYVKTLAISNHALSKSYKFRSARKLTLKFSNYLGYNNETDIAKGIENYIGDKIIHDFLFDLDIVIVIPKGNIAYNSNGREYVLTEDTPIKLGTEFNNATFRRFFESHIIPRLKQGIITEGRPPVSFISSNKFISDLAYTLQKTPLGNVTIVETLPINMLPRTDIETGIFNKYSQEFGKLIFSEYRYNSEKYGEQKKGLLDLFTLYAMIANNWKLGEKSLVKMVSTYNDNPESLVSKLYEFEAKLDRSGKTLSADSYDEVLPYIAPSTSPYRGYTQSIRYKDSTSNTYKIMEKPMLPETEEEMEMMGEEYQELMESSINGYVFKSSNVDINYFTTGNLRKFGSITYTIPKETNDSFESNITIITNDDGKIGYVSYYEKLGDDTILKILPLEKFKRKLKDSNSPSGKETIDLIKSLVNNAIECP